MRIKLCGFKAERAGSLVLCIILLTKSRNGSMVQNWVMNFSKITASIQMDGCIFIWIKRVDPLEKDGTIFRRLLRCWHLLPMERQVMTARLSRKLLHFLKNV